MQRFPTQQHNRISEIVQVGDVLLTEGHVRARDWWPPCKAPETVGKLIVYKSIRAYNRANNRRNPKITHARIVTDFGKFFEYTYPRARFGPFTKLAGKKVTICRPRFPFDPTILVDECWKTHDSSYDIGELARFAAEELAERAKGGLKFLLKAVGDMADRERRWVCSTGVARVLHYATNGQQLKNWTHIDPAWYYDRAAPFASYIIKRVVVD